MASDAQTIRVPKLAKVKDREVIEMHFDPAQEESRTDGLGDPRGRLAHEDPDQCPLAKRQKSDA